MAQIEVIGDKGQVLAMRNESVVDAERRRLEDERKARVRRVRMYYAGEQFASRNKARADAMAVPVWELAEHEKLHAYSTQLQEAVDYIASQMSDSFALSMDDEALLERLLNGLKRSPELQGGYGENDISVTNVVRDALLAQDTPVHVRWDAVEGVAWPEFWDSELVEFVYADRDRYLLERVVTSQMVWDTDLSGNPLRKKEISEWYLNGVECVKEVYFESERDRGQVHALGLPFIPWVTLRCNRKNAKALRGESIITDQAMGHADRYNAVEQVSYLIARYNSHGNVAVIGDGATLKAQLDERINKDVADILTFPGGTALQVLTLPTDPQMIEHQRTALIDALFGVFGLARIDQETLTGLGQVTGYALEILNRKSDGTFRQIRNQYVGDFKRMLNMMLDVTAYKDGEGEALDALLDDGFADLSVPYDFAAVGEAMISRMDGIDPEAVFPKAKRVFKIHLGAGYVVDRAMLQADYAAKLISRAEYLRQMGYTDDEIKAIEKEIDKEAPPAPPTGLGAGAIAGAQLAIGAAAAGAKVPAALAGNASKAGTPPVAPAPKPAVKTGG